MAYDEKQNGKGGYGKRPLWQWIAIYLIIGAVVYGAIYYFAFYKKGNGYNNNTGTGSTQTSPSPY